MEKTALQNGQMQEQNLFEASQSEYENPELKNVDANTVNNGKKSSVQNSRSAYENPHVEALTKTSINNGSMKSQNCLEDEYDNLQEKTGVQGSQLQGDYQNPLVDAAGQK